MLTGIETVKSIEKFKPEVLNKPDKPKIFGIQIGDLKNPTVFKDHLEKVLQDNPNLKDQWNRAIDSGDNKQIGMVRGRIVNEVIKSVLNDFCDKVESEKPVTSENGRNYRTDLTAEAKDRLAFSGHASDTIETGQKFSIEIKAGGEKYLGSELTGHGKEQASAHEGKSVIVVTADFKDLPKHKQAEIREKLREQGTTVIVGLPRSSTIDSLIKQVV